MRKKLSFSTCSPLETKEVSHAILQTISIAKPRRGASVVGLFGELGSGKTTLVQGVAEELSLTETIQSPTFVLLKIYRLPPTAEKKYSWRNLFHIDAYRLSSGRELITLGWDEISSNPENVVFVEWPERVQDVWKKEYPSVFLQHKKGDQRYVRVVLS